MNPSVSRAIARAAVGSDQKQFGGSCVSRDLSNLLVVGVAALSMFGLTPTTELLFKEWFEIDLPGGGAAVFAIAAFSYWRRAVDTGPARVRPSPFGLIVEMLLVTLWCTAAATGLFGFQVAVLPCVVLASIWAAFGGSVAVKMLLPTCILFLSMPMWSSVAEILQLVATWVVGHSIAAIGIPVRVVGTTVAIPSGQFEIELGCSGIAYVQVSMTCALLLGLMELWPMRAVAVITAIFGIIGVVANWLRIFLIVLIGNATDMKHPIVQHHVGFGWLVFGFAIGVAMLGSRWRLMPILDGWKGSYAGEAMSNISTSSQFSRSRIATILVSSLAVATPAIAGVWVRSRPVGIASQDVTLPAQVAGYALAENLPPVRTTLLGSIPAQIKASHYASAQGRRFDARVLLFDESLQYDVLAAGVARYLENSAIQSSSISEPSMLLASSRQGGSEGARARWADSRGSVHDARYYYVVGSDYTGSRKLAKLLRLRQAFNDKAAVGFLVVSLECGVDCVTTDEDAERLARGIANAIEVRSAAVQISPSHKLTSRPERKHP